MRPLRSISQPLIAAPAPQPSLAMKLRLACPSAWPRLVAPPPPPSPRITGGLVLVLGEPPAE
eukprot:COSAG06_NODE_63752_length_261_cov_0.950617_1_plen_61_part_10